MVPGWYTAFCNDKIMIILHRELERKVGKVKHMNLEVMLKRALEVLEE